jgi:hypothetical protein
MKGKQVGKKHAKLIIYISVLIALYSMAYPYFFPFTFNSAHTMGMAGAFTSVDSVEYCFDYNPAALTSSGSLPFGLYTRKFAYAYLPPAAGGKTTGAIAAEKISFFGFNSGFDLGYTVVDGRKNIWPFILGYYNGPDFRLLSNPLSPVFGYAYDLGRLSAGINLHISRYHDSFIGDYWKSVEVDFADIGVIYRLNSVILFGASLRRYDWQMFKSGSIYTSGDYVIFKYEKPSGLNIGFSYRPDKADLFALDLWNEGAITVAGLPKGLPAPPDPGTSLHAGFEHFFNDWFACRTGFIRQREYDNTTGAYETWTTVSAGLGFIWKWLRADFAAADDLKDTKYTHDPFQFYMTVVCDF